MGRSRESAKIPFNAQDGGLLSWERFFYELARWYGVDGVHGPEEDESKYRAQKLTGGKDAPLGYNPPLLLNQSSTVVQWAKQSETKKAWEEMMRKSNGHLKKNVFEGNSRDLFMIGDFTYLLFRTPPMNKTRRFGLGGFVDTLEGVFETV